MTTDDFTTAAAAEGQARIAAMLEVAGASADIRAWFPAGFEKGAEWARDHLAAQESDGERAVRALHSRFGVYEHEDACPDRSDEHREAHHHEDSDGYGENYCDQMPLYAACDHCRDGDGERADWPCPTILALDSARNAGRAEA